jgi:WD40 repeat protein
MWRAARIARAHTRGGVLDFAVCGGLLATASSDQTAAVWGVDTRVQLARLTGHTLSVISVDMNDRLVFTASTDTTVRVYNAERDYSCTAVLGCLSLDAIQSVAIIGDDHILTATDHSVCATQLSSTAVVGLTRLLLYLICATALPDSRIALCGLGGSAAVFDAPAAAADILRAHS